MLESTTVVPWSFLGRGPGGGLAFVPNLKRIIYGRPQKRSLIVVGKKSEGYR
jgi:hypothetical protein